MTPTEHESTAAATESSPASYPTTFQKKTLWGAITGLSFVLIGVVAVFLVWIITRVLVFLQPVLVPLAIAGILAYLLEPIIRRLVKRGVKESRAMLYVYGCFHLLIAMLALLVLPPAIKQSLDFVNSRNFTATFSNVAKTIRQEHIVTPEELGKMPTWQQKWYKFAQAHQDSVKSVTDDVAHWWEENRQGLLAKVGKASVSSFQGVLGVMGYLIGFALIPLYLYYFLKDGASISKTWADYLPLRRSQFKTEVVETLTEINGYLIAFFRGQMLVSMVDGLLIGVLLALIGLPYGLLIGVCVALLGLLPYIGNLVCWIPAVLISVAHFSQPAEQWEIFHGKIWPYPVLVTAIFFIVQKINSFVTTPKIVGDSVGLHPLTVIFSVLFWSLLIGGFLGALLAVPLTAAIKVLFRRYIWEKRVQPRLPLAANSPTADSSPI
jgi:predicted PurR-regulated permease PerM